MDELSILVERMYASDMQDLEACRNLFELVKTRSSVVEHFRVALDGLGPLQSELDKFCADPSRAQVLLQMIDLDKHYMQRFVNRCKIIVLADSIKPC